uniref:Uncharacterized protein n=1 Tax=Myripristis murdjan TaxID=586833 RepID=A0A667WK86_9TELE
MFQKRLARPISKLLNPLAPGSGYSLAVALNFTQTKIQMPNTKQSSISSFFVPQLMEIHSKNYYYPPDQPLSNRKWADPKPASSQKPIPKLLWRTAEEESLSSQCKWTKPNGSPLKKCAPKQPCREAEEDSLAMLFTQDSEGFRVIAHRSLHARSPFKDHTNVSTGMMRRAGAYKPVVEDEEEEMLFTQDSQGNMVIKH